MSLIEDAIKREEAKAKEPILIPAIEVEVEEVKAEGGSGTAGKGSGNMEDINKELAILEESISNGDLKLETADLDSEMHLIIANEVEGAILESTAKVSKQFRTTLTNEVVMQIYERANDVGKAFIMKEVLRGKFALINSAKKLANGGKYKTITTKTETVIINDIEYPKVTVTEKIEEIPPHGETLKYLFGFVDGRTAIGKAIKRETKEAIDDVINKQ